MKITLTGYMGVGKTQVGKHLAVHLGLDFFDLDVRIEQKTGTNITDLILNRGELYFRQREREVLEDVLQRPSFVLSTGGGTPCYYDNIDIINQHSVSIYLQADVARLYERLQQQRQERPLIAHISGNELREYIGKHLFERVPFYEKAIFHVSVAGKSIAEIAAEIKALVQAD